MFEKVIDILSEFSEIDKNKIGVESDLIKDLGLNSLDVVNLIVAFEDEFDIVIPDSKLKEFSTVGDIEKYLIENV